jgi:MFS family permease
VNLGAYLIDRRPLTIPAFRRLWTASAVSAVGGSFSLIAVPTQLFTMTGSSAAVGISASVSMGALIISALWCGALADAMDRRRLLLAGNAGLGLTYLGLWLHAVLELRSVATLLVLLAMQGVSFGATMTTMGAAVPRVVPADQLVAANSLSSLTRYTGAVVGPLLAGVLIPITGLGALYLLDALALCVVLWAVSKLPAMPPSEGARAHAPHTKGTLRQLLECLRYLVGRRVLVAILAVDLAAMVSPCHSHSSRSWPSARMEARSAAVSSLVCCSRRTRPACSSPACSREHSAGRRGTARSWRRPRSPGALVWCFSGWQGTSGSHSRR